jgi:hypothetical protein
VVKLIHSVSVLINDGGVAGVKGVRNLINEKHFAPQRKRGHRGKIIVLKLFSQCAALSALIALSTLSANKFMKSKR